MAFATIEDVKRVGKITDPNNAVNFTQAIKVAEEWVRKYLGKKFTASGSVTETFYNVRDDEILELSDEDVTVNSVKVYVAPGSTASTLSADAYMVHDRQKVQLSTRGGPFPNLGYISGGGGVLGGRPLAAYYAKVEVVYTAGASVPEPVRDATALIAAAWVKQSAQEAGGKQSENLGDYSYSRGATGGQTWIPAAARTLLKPWKKSRVSVV